MPDLFLTQLIDVFELSMEREIKIIVPNKEA